MRHFKQKVLALAMAAAMTLSLSSVAFAAEFSDMPTNWSRPAMEAAVENGLLKGTDGKLNPGGKLQRSEMATIMVRAFGATVAADLSGYIDVPAGEWYADAIAKAAQMGVINGSGNSMAPSRNIQRQEAFLILARALKLEDGTAADLSAFSDASSVASWALGGVAAMVKAGYVNGSDGKLDPTGAITREQFAQVMYNAFATYITEAGEVTELPEGNVVVRAGGVTLKDVTVKGDLIIGDGVGEGDVILDNVTVDGRMVVRGGGVNSIHIVNSTVTNVIITKTFGSVRVVADADSTVSVTVTDTAKGATIEGSVENLTVATTAPVTVANASVAAVAVTAANAKISMTGDTTVSTMTVNVTGVTVSTDADVTIITVSTTVNVVVTGDGEVGNVTGTGSVTDTPVTQPDPDPDPSTPSTPSDPGDDEHEHNVVNWDGDKGGETHSGICVVCGERVTGEHDFDEDDVCTVCGYEVHEHIWEWEQYANGHRGVCTVSGCNEFTSFADHDTNGEGGVVCSVCGFNSAYATHTHSAAPAAGDEAWQKDADTHWYLCTAANCYGPSEKRGTSPHDTKGTNGACSVCGYKPDTGDKELGTPNPCTSADGMHIPAPGCGVTFHKDGTHGYDCGACGQYVIEKCDDDFVEAARPATCSNWGNTAGTSCSKCGGNYKAEELPMDPDAHDWSGKDGVCKYNSSHVCTVDHSTMAEDECEICGAPKSTGGGT